MYACIDLGSNSFHLLIGVRDGGRIRIIERLSEKVQLGENVGATGRISPGAWQRGLDCLQRFKSLMDHYPLRGYWALGTNTFRVAENAEEFIRAAGALDIGISIISGVQEAVLIYAGVITALPDSGSRRLVIDIGGGSTEVIVGRGHERLLTESLAIGSVAWRDRFFSAAGSSPGRLLERMEQGAEQARRIFSAVAPGVRRAGWEEAYASSGTVKMLACICQEHGHGRITLEALHELREAMARAVADGAAIAGLNERRRDLLLPGWCVLTGLMESYGVESINFSASALREGMFDFMVKNEKTFKLMASSGLPDVTGTGP